MKVLPALAPLEFMTIKILVQPVTTPPKEKYLLVITDFFSKLVRMARFTLPPLKPWPKQLSLIGLWPMAPQADR